MTTQAHVVYCSDLPGEINTEVVYCLSSKDVDAAYYAERTDRNIGWITREEQYQISKSVIGVAGCGGMGGQLAEKFLRLGVGEVRIADCEVFDVSNLNRQFAATRSTIGRSKAIETAKMLRHITDDSTLRVYPQGIREDTVADFVRGCDVICDEIEFWCVGSRILLHRTAREFGIPVFVCNTVGFGSHVFLFTPNSGTMEECFGLDYAEAKSLEGKITNRTAKAEEVVRVMEVVTQALFFEWPEYSADGSPMMNRISTRERLVREGRGAIIATNPPFACGFVADRVLLHLLRSSSITRNIVEIPEMPGYLYLDAAKMEAKVIKGKWWSHAE